MFLRGEFYIEIPDEQLKTFLNNYALQKEGEFAQFLCKWTGVKDLLLHQLILTEGKWEGKIE